MPGLDPWCGGVFGKIAAPYGGEGEVAGLAPAGRWLEIPALHCAAPNLKGLGLAIGSFFSSVASSSNLFPYSFSVGKA